MKLATARLCFCRCCWASESARCSHSHMHFGSSPPSPHTFPHGRFTVLEMGKLSQIRKKLQWMSTRGCTTGAELVTDPRVQGIQMP